VCQADSGEKYGLDSVLSLVDGKRRFGMVASRGRQQTSS
jgi:hypothetical protein